jgi:hypothetical protein
MAQVTKIDPAVFEDFASLGESVATVPLPVAVVPPVAQPLPAWYLTPVAIVPVAAATFVIGNVLMMIPWSAF